MPNGTFQSTASHDERCTLASHAITVARGCRRNRNRHRYDLPRRPPAPTRRMALAAQACCRHVSDASGEPGSGKTWAVLATLRRAKFDIGVRSSKDGNQVPGGGLCPLRRMSTRRSTRQDAQINYLSTLSIFMKQTTYLATLPNPNLKANECPCF